jgi:hypothetical protein
VGPWSLAKKRLETMPESLAGSFLPAANGPAEPAIMICFAEDNEAAQNRLT